MTDTLVATAFMELLIVEIDHAYIGVPTADVKEVVRAARLAPAPPANARIKGLLNLRGTVVPVVSMRKLLGISDRDILANDHFIVLQTHMETFAIHVDRAAAIQQVTDPPWNDADQESAVFVPHKDFGVIQIHRGCSLKAQAGLPSASGSPNIVGREVNPLP